MKKLLIIFLAIALSGCDKNDEPRCAGVDCLPPATQTGAGTFGCLVNGEPFVDKSRSFNCFYQFVDGNFFFNICGLDEEGVLTDLCLRTNKRALVSNEIINIDSNSAGSFFVSIGIKDDRLRFFDSTSSSSGTVILTEFNTNSNIVSATFEFTVVDPTTGTIYEITEGRFDTVFTQ